MVTKVRGGYCPTPWTPQIADCVDSTGITRQRRLKPPCNVTALTRVKTFPCSETNEPIDFVYGRCIEFDHFWAYSVYIKSCRSLKTWNPQNIRDGINAHSTVIKKVSVLRLAKCSVNILIIRHQRLLDAFFTDESTIDQRFLHNRHLPKLQFFSVQDSLCSSAKKHCPWKYKERILYRRVKRRNSGTITWFD